MAGVDACVSKGCRTHWRCWTSSPTLLPLGAPLLLASDDTLWRRTGRKLHGAAQYQQGHPDLHTLDLFPDLLLTRVDPAA